MTVVSSDNQSAFPFSFIGPLIKLRIVLMTRSAIDEPLSVNRDQCCIFLLEKILKDTVIEFSSPIAPIAF